MSATSPGKRQRGACSGQQVPQVLGRYDYTVLVASVKENLSVTKGTVNGMDMDIILDSGSSVSLLCKDVASQMKNPILISPTVRPQLVTASGDSLHIVDYMQGLVAIDKLEVFHNFIVVSELITPAILGVLDFSTVLLSIMPAHQNSSAAIPQTTFSPPIPDSLRLILEQESKQQVKACAAAVVTDSSSMVEDSLIPTFGGPVAYDFPVQPLHPC